MTKQMSQVAEARPEEMSEQELTHVNGGLIGLLRPATVTADGSVTQAVAGDGSVRGIIAI